MEQWKITLGKPFPFSLENDMREDMHTPTLIVFQGSRINLQVSFGAIGVFWLSIYHEPEQTVMPIIVKHFFREQ